MKPLCERTFAIHKPGIKIVGVFCQTRYTGSIPCTGAIKCHMCGKTYDKPSYLWEEEKMTMDQITKKYRETQLKSFDSNQINLIRINLKIVQSSVGETNWLTLTKEEFDAIKKILTGEEK